MNYSLASKLVRFSMTQGSYKEKFKYLLLSLVFYYFLLKEDSATIRNISDGSKSQAGDDIYPIF